ncbi:MAG: PilZ domain-containing protein [Acidobacteriia bacterium]|nr:PilZ domain-containing protein [Terriglobia bacterium]
MANADAERRTQKRVEAAVPIQVRWTDPHGETVEEFTEALEVSRRGLSFLTHHDVPMFTNLTVVIPGRGPMRPGEGPSDFFSTATVVRVLQEEKQYRIGVRFVGATLPMYSAESA